VRFRGSGEPGEPVEWVGAWRAAARGGQNGGVSDTVIQDWAARVRMTIPSSGPDVVRGWGDMETAFEVRRHHGRFAVVKSDHGTARIAGTFQNEADADRYLLLLFANAWRSEQRRPALWQEDPAPGTTIDEGPTSIDLTWPTGEAEFPTGRVGRAAAVQYSHASGKSLAAISAALLAD